jgi:hypothetical protein
VIKATAVLVIASLLGVDLVGLVVLKGLLSIVLADLAPEIPLIYPSHLIALGNCRAGPNPRTCASMPTP